MPGVGVEPYRGERDRAKCIAKKAGETRSNQAAVFVGAACRKLYDEAPAGMKPFTGKLDGQS